MHVTTDTSLCSDLGNAHPGQRFTTYELTSHPKALDTCSTTNLETAVTCPSLLRRHPAVDAVSQAADELRTGSAERLGRVLRTLRAGDASSAQFARFVVVGGLSSLLYAVLFVAFDAVGDQPANLVGAVGSTLLANELHRRLTFQAGGQVTWFTAQWEGGGLAVVGLVATSLALAGLHQVVGETSWQLQVLLIGAVTGAIGLVRFVALRTWVFTARTLQRG